MDDKISKLIELLINENGSFSFIWRDNLECNSHCKQFELELRKFLIKENRVSKWPGTQLESGSATIRYYNLDKESAKIISSAASPFEYLSPDYPEDLALYKNGNNVYGSCSHEKLHFFSYEDTNELDK